LALDQLKKYAKSNSDIISPLKTTADLDFLIDYKKFIENDVSIKICHKYVIRKKITATFLSVTV
jgi:hypothetical protein